ncbi:MAG: translation elongation factor Ts, partial [Gammaproteobacteria bacterium]|nr:translation elongation factor Ts [Gammaproteobacteria bacterium]
MIITASLVKELRDHTGAGMMECKKALEEANGNLEAAITIMRKSGQAKAAKKGGRIAAEGVVVVKMSDDNKKAIMLEVNCETDFAARDSSFLEFANTVASYGLTNQITSIDKLHEMVLEDGKTVLDARDALVATIGENINIRRIDMMTVAGDAIINSYIHNGRIGVLVGVSVANADLARDIAMHITAFKPLAVLPEELPAALIEKEREIYLSQLQDTNKPQQILEKIVDGRIQKFISESVLVKQAFVKNPDITVEDLLKQSNASILGFARFEVGEGIEK